MQKLKATKGLSSTVSEINRDFSQKSQNFPTRVFCIPPLRGSRWNLVLVLGVKSYNDGLLGRERSLTIIFNSVDTIHECDRQTDGQMDTGRQQSIASHGKN